MFINNRAVFSDNLVYEDISLLCSDPHTGKKSLTIVAAQDALYIGSDFPFNHRFFMLGAKNISASVVSVAIWDGTQFTACEDVQDDTSVNGVPFARNGIIRWELPDDTGWYRVQNFQEIFPLATIKSRAKYWAEFTFSVDIAMDIEYVGFRFARDADLGTYYRSLLKPELMKAFNLGSPMQNWDSVHILASEEVIKDLRANDIIYSPNQILNPELFTQAACHKLAEMAWAQLRNQEMLEFAQAKYKSAMALKNFDVDKDNDGRLDDHEKVGSGRLRRV